MRLFIIGNGFDLLHECNTKYLDFKKYLDKESIEIGSFYLSDIFNETCEDEWNNFEELLEDYNFVHWGSSYSENIYVEDDKEQDRNMSYNNGLNEYFREISNLLPQKIKTIGLPPTKTYRSNYYVKRTNIIVSHLFYLVKGF